MKNNMKLKIAMLVFAMCSLGACKNSSNDGAATGTSGDSDMSTSPGSNIDDNLNDASGSSMPANDTMNRTGTNATEAGSTSGEAGTGTTTGTTGTTTGTGGTTGTTNTP